jgi:hypothetical protein
MSRRIVLVLLLAALSASAPSMGEGGDRPGAGYELVLTALPPEAFQAPSAGVLEPVHAAQSDGAASVTVVPVQTDFQRLNADVVESAWELRVTNTGLVPTSVTLGESFSGDWLVISESAPHQRLDDATASWRVRVPAGGEVLLRYRVRVRG